jgi:hypothetical protein
MPQGNGFVVYLRLVCPGDAENVREGWCSGAMRAFAKGMENREPPFWFCIRFCYKRRFEVVSQGEIAVHQQMGQVGLTGYLKGVEERDAPGLPSRPDPSGSSGPIRPPQRTTPESPTGEGRPAGETASTP